MRPVCQIGLSDERGAEPDTWLDVSCYVHEVELFRGRDRFTERFQPGTASLTFDNRTGWGDLVGSPSVVATQTLRPGRPIRVGVEGPWEFETATVRWLWRGWIDQATPRYDPTLHDIVAVNCIDAFGEAGAHVIPTGRPPRRQRDGVGPDASPVGRRRLVERRNARSTRRRRRCTAPSSAARAST